MIKHFLLAVCVFACVPAQASSEKKTWTEYVQAFRGDPGRAGTRSHRHHRYYRRSPYRRAIPDRIPVDEAVVARHEYNCNVVPTFEAKEEYRYAEVNISAWLDSVSPKTWYKLSLLSSKNGGW